MVNPRFFIYDSTRIIILASGVYSLNLLKKMDQEVLHTKIQSHVTDIAFIQNQGLTWPPSFFADMAEYLEIGYAFIQLVGTYQWRGV